MIFVNLLNYGLIRNKKQNKGCGKKSIFFALVFVLFFLLVKPVAALSYSSVTIEDIEPTSLQPGDTREVTLTVANHGSKSAKDVKLSFQGTKFVSIVGPTVKYIDWLTSRDSEKITITVHIKEEAPTGAYAIPVSASWLEKNVNVNFSTGRTNYYLKPMVRQLGLGFNVKGEASINVGDIITDPATIRPEDQNVKIAVAIGNSGESSVEDVEAKLITNDKFSPSWSGTSRSYLGKLNSGFTKKATFHIDIAQGIEAKEYSLPLRITYEDTDEVEHQLNKSIEILVEPKPDFEIASFRTVPSNISGGDHVKLYVNIKNTGSEDAESISIRSIGEVDVPFDFKVKSAYVGNLKPDETSEAVLEFDVKQEAEPKAYPQGIEIRCTGDRDIGDYNVYVFDKQIRLKVNPGEEEGLGLPAVPGFEALFSLLALTIGFLLVKKRR